MSTNEVKSDVVVGASTNSIPLPSSLTLTYFPAVRVDGVSVSDANVDAEEPPLEDEPP